ncbi:hypothetical protein F5880DRAFT_1511883 [Lentinula raphanica]|nr:hypothetical protein F5880DRAFT_1511883 [Lentinula raphanica]
MQRTQVAKNEMSIDNLYNEAQAKSVTDIKTKKKIFTTYRRRGERQAQNKHKNGDALTQAQKKGWEADMKITKFYQPNCWRIIWVNGSDAPPEVVFHMQGVVEGKCLPPFKKVSERQAKKIRHTRQWVTISGLGSKAFEKDREGIMEVYATFARIANGLGGIEFKTSNDHDSVEIGNHMFTPKEEAPDMEWADIEDDMDTMGFMQWVKTSDIGLTYGEENVVKYGEEYTKVTKEKPEGVKRTSDIIPQKIHVGDIVDIGFTMIGIEGGRMMPVKAKLVLRTVTLLDSTHAQDWIKAKAKAQGSGLNRRMQIGKRTFDDDEIEGTRKRFQFLTTEDSEE